MLPVPAGFFPSLPLPKKKVGNRVWSWTVNLGGEAGKSLNLSIIRHACYPKGLEETEGPELTIKKNLDHKNNSNVLG